MDPVDDNLEEKEVIENKTSVSRDGELNESPLCDNEYLSHSKVHCSSEDELVKIFSQRSGEPSNYELEGKTSDSKTENIAAVIGHVDNELEAELEQSVFCLEQILSEDDKENLEHKFCEEIPDEPNSVSDENTVSEVETVESIVESDEDNNENINIRHILAADEVSNKLKESIDQALHDQLMDDFEVIEKEVTDENNQLLIDDVNDTMNSRDSDWETEEEILVTEADDEEMNKMAEKMLSKSLMSELEQDVDIENDMKESNTFDVSSPSPLLKDSNTFDVSSLSPLLESSGADWLLSSISSPKLGEGLSPTSPLESSKTNAIVELLATSSLDPEVPNPTWEPDIPGITNVPSPTLETGVTSPLDPNVPTLEATHASSKDSIESSSIVEAVSTSVSDSNILLPPLESEIASSPLHPNEQVSTSGVVKASSPLDTSQARPTLDVIRASLESPALDPLSASPFDPKVPSYTSDPKVPSYTSEVAETSSLESPESSPRLDPATASPLDPNVPICTSEVAETTSLESPDSSPIMEPVIISGSEMEMSTSALDSNLSNSDLEVAQSALSTTLEEEDTLSQTFVSDQTSEDVVAPSSNTEESCSCSTEPIFSVSTLSHLSNSDKEFGWSSKVSSTTGSSTISDVLKDTETANPINDSPEATIIMEDRSNLSPEHTALKAPDVIIKEELIDGNVEDKSTPATPSSTPTKCNTDVTKTDLLMSLLNNIKDKEDENSVSNTISDESNIQQEQITSRQIESKASVKIEVLVMNESDTDEKNTPVTPTSTPTKCVPDIPKANILKSLLDHIKDDEGEKETDQVGDLYENQEGTENSDPFVQHVTEPDTIEYKIDNVQVMNSATDRVEEIDYNEDEFSIEADPPENTMQKSVQSDILKKMIVKEINILHSSTEKLEIDSSNDVPDNEDTKLSYNFLKPKIQVDPEISDCSDFAEERKVKTKPSKAKKKKGKKYKNKNKPDLSRENLARIMLPMRLECEESEILQELLTPVYSSQESLYSSHSSLTPKSRSHQNLDLIPPPDYSTRDNLDVECSANFETIESLRLPNEDPVPCEPLASLSLEGKMSVPGGAWFPWKTMSFILLIATAAIINIDVNKHGNFKRSNTGQFMKDIGQYDRSMAAYKFTTTSAVAASVMAKEYSNQGYTLARKYAGPSMDVASAKVSEVSGLVVKYGVAGMENAREVVKAGVDKVGVMLPGLEDQARVYWLATKDLAARLASALSQGWKDVTSGNVEIDWDGLKTGAVEKAVYLQKQLEQVLQWAKDQINTLVK